MRVNISSHNLNLKNSWGGEWVSTWDIMHTLGTDQFQLVGKIRVHNHYFEQGNIRFDLAKNYPTPIEGSSEGGSIAKGIAALIKKTETEYQQSLDQVYDDMSN